MKFRSRALLLLAICIVAVACSPVSEEMVFDEPVTVEKPSLDPSAPSDAIAEPPPYRDFRTRTPARAGTLTAGDIDDALNLASFKRMARKASKSLGLPDITSRQTISLVFVGPEDTPAPGVRVTLRRPGATEPFYSGYTGVGGRLTVFSGLYGQQTLSKIELRAFDEFGQSPFIKFLSPGHSIKVVLPFKGGWQPEFLDLALALDTTGSMDDEMAWLTRDLFRIVDQAKRVAPGVDIRFALVTYKDHGDTYVVKNYGFTKNRRTMRGWLRAESASGGGDYPEAAAQALASAADLNWRRGMGERLLFHIADAPPHRGKVDQYLRAAKDATLKGVQIFGLGASGVATEAEYLMRQAAVVSGGRYLFLTDDSGVGRTHAEPSISCYRVTQLSGLLRRVLMSELGGTRVEAAKKDIIRTVGTYRNGFCLN